jgi:hypothetical protein
MLGNKSVVQTPLTAVDHILSFKLMASKVGLWETLPPVSRVETIR